MKEIQSDFSQKPVVIHSSASIANLVCGFDVLGMALQEPYDLMEMQLSEEPGIRIHHLDNFNLPEGPDLNVAGASLSSLLKSIRNPPGIELSITKNIKPGSGLGSSGASAAGAVVLANDLLGNIFSQAELLSFAMDGEQLAGGTRHADNVAAVIYGGITLVRSQSLADVVKLQFPPLWVTIIHPQIEIKTSVSRNILPREIMLKDAVTQWANISGLVAGLLQEDYGLISRSLEDVIFEPVRSMLIPGFDMIKRRSREMGALGSGIAGAGPSVFALSSNQKTAKDIEQELKRIYAQIGVDHFTYVTTVNPQGIQFPNR